MTSPNNSVDPNDKAAFNVSFFQGIQCYFDIGEHTISVWGSAWSGREIVRVDNQVVSDSRNLSLRQNRHDFTLGGVSYYLVFKTESILRGHYGVYLYRGDTLIDSDDGCYTLFRMGKWPGWRGVLLWVLLYFGSGAIFGFLGVLVYIWLSGGSS